MAGRVLKRKLLGFHRANGMRSYKGACGAKRGRVAVTISIPHAVPNEYDRIARATGKNRSEVFRDMFDKYRRQSNEELFTELQRYGVHESGTARRARSFGTPPSRRRINVAVGVARA